MLSQEQIAKEISKDLVTLIRFYETKFTVRDANYEFTKEKFF